MAPENVQVVHLKLEMQPDVNFFEKLLKDNQAQEICKNLRIYPSLQDVHFLFLRRGIILWIELPRPENPANTGQLFRSY